MAIRRWRLWASILIGLGIVVQLGAAKNDLAWLHDLFQFPEGAQLGLVYYFMGISVAVVSFILIIIGQRIAGLVTAAASLGLNVVSTVAWMVGDLTKGFSLSETIQREVLGLATDSEGVKHFYPSVFVSGIPAFILVGAAIVVVALGTDASQYEDASGVTP